MRARCPQFFTEHIFSRTPINLIHLLRKRALGCDLRRSIAARTCVRAVLLQRNNSSETRSIYSGELNRLRGNRPPARNPHLAPGQWSPPASWLGAVFGPWASPSPGGRGGAPTARLRTTTRRGSHPSGLPIQWQIGTDARARSSDAPPPAARFNGQCRWALLHSNANNEYVLLLR